MKAVSVILLSGFLTLGAAVCGAVEGAGNPATAIDPLDLLPGGLPGLAYMNLKHLAETGAYDNVMDFVASQLEEPDKDPREILKALKLDIKKDLNAGALAFESIGKDDAKLILVVTGSFDTRTFYKVMKEREPRARTVFHKGHKIRLENDGKARAVLNGKVLITGTEDLVRKVIDIYKGDAKPGAKNSPLMDRAKGLGDQTFWLVADLNIPPQPEGEDPGLATTIPGLDSSKIKTVTISGRITGEAFDIKAVLGCVDAGSAATLVGGLSQAVNRWVAMSTMATAGDPESAQTVIELTQAMDINSEGASATVRVTITAELAEKLKALGEKMIETQGFDGGGMMGPGGMMEMDGAD